MPSAVCGWHDTIRLQSILSWHCRRTNLPFFHRHLPDALPNVRKFKLKNRAGITLKKQYIIKPENSTALIWTAVWKTNSLTMTCLKTPIWQAHKLNAMGWIFRSNDLHSWAAMFIILWRELQKNVETLAFRSRPKRCGLWMTGKITRPMRSTG